jgi:hypothetical protein
VGLNPARLQDLRSKVIKSVVLCNQLETDVNISFKIASKT